MFDRDNKDKAAAALPNLVILLGDDRVAIVEMSGLGPFARCRGIAEKPDLPKIKAAARQPASIGGSWQSAVGSRQ